MESAGFYVKTKYIFNIMYYAFPFEIYIILKGRECENYSWT